MSVFLSHHPFPNSHLTRSPTPYLPFLLSHSPTLNCSLHPLLPLSFPPHSQYLLHSLFSFQTDLKHTERLLQEREDSLEELRQELRMANSLVSFLQSKLLVGACMMLEFCTIRSLQRLSRHTMGPPLFHSGQLWWSHCVFTQSL